MNVNGNYIVFGIAVIFLGILLFNPAQELYRSLTEKPDVTILSPADFDYILGRGDDILVVHVRESRSALPKDIPFAAEISIPFDDLEEISFDADTSHPVFVLDNDGEKGEGAGIVIAEKGYQVFVIQGGHKGYLDYLYSIRKINETVYDSLK